MTDREKSYLGELTRRDVIRLLSCAATAGVSSYSRDNVELLAAAFQAGGPDTLRFPQGAIIRTVLKDLPPGALASRVTLFHEHLSINLPPLPNAPPAAAPPTYDVDLVVREVKIAATEGVGCIVDGGQPEMGRDMATLKRVASETNVHVVAGGGHYMQRTYPPEIGTKTEDQIADDLVNDAARDRLGAFGEIGQSADAADMTSDERKVFRAVGKAHVRTGVPIFTHNAYGTGPNVKPDAGLVQLDLLESVGVNPQHVVIGHACCLDDTTAVVLKRIAQRGAFVGLDRVTGGRVPDEKKIRTLVALLDGGYSDNVLISSDFTGSRSAQRPGYGNSVTMFVPLMRKAGVKEDIVRQILYDNPRRFLAFVPKQR